MAHKANTGVDGCCKGFTIIQFQISSIPRMAFFLLRPRYLHCQVVRRRQGAPTVSQALLLTVAIARLQGPRRQAIQQLN